MDSNKLQELIWEHEKKLNELETKSSQNRYYGKYELAQLQEDEADNHRNMLVYYRMMMERVN